MRPGAASMRSSFLRFGYVFAIAVAIVYAFFTLRGPHGIPAWMEKRNEIRELEQQNAAISRDNQLKKERIERLRTSAEEQEIEIRKRLKMVRPNEKVYIYGQ
jgi:cell division protein FtsB